MTSTFRQARRRASLGRTILVAFSFAAASGTALAGELISGTNRYTTVQRTWPAGQHAGYYMYDSVGEIEMRTGPFPDGAVECHGAGFWTQKQIFGEGICIFGSPPDRWTVAFQMDGDNTFDAQIKDTYRRRGTWRVVEGTGKYWGMKGAGTFVSGPVVDGAKTTEWEGEVELLK